MECNMGKKYLKLLADVNTLNQKCKVGAYVW